MIVSEATASTISSYQSASGAKWTTVKSLRSHDPGRGVLDCRHGHRQLCLCRKRWQRHHHRLRRPPGSAHRARCQWRYRQRGRREWSRGHGGECGQQVPLRRRRGTATRSPPSRWAPTVRSRRSSPPADCPPELTGWPRARLLPYVLHPAGAAAARTLRRPHQRSLTAVGAPPQNHSPARAPRHGPRRHGGGGGAGGLCVRSASRGSPHRTGARGSGDGAGGGRRSGERTQRRAHHARHRFRARGRARRGGRAR